MKIIYILAIVSFLSGCEADSSALKNTGTKEIITTVLEIRNDMAYLPNQNIPYTGKFELYYPGYDCLFEGISLMGSRVDVKTENSEKIVRTLGGKINYLLKWWQKISNSQGQKCIEENYKDGKRNGLVTEWHKNGQKSSEDYYKLKFPKNSSGHHA